MDRFEELWEDDIEPIPGGIDKEALRGVLEYTWDNALIALAHEIIEDEDMPEEFDLASEAYITKKIKKVSTQDG